MTTENASLRADGLAAMRDVCDEFSESLNAGYALDATGLDSLYESDGVFSRAIDLPVRDAFKAGVGLRSDDDGAEWIDATIDALEDLDWIGQLRMARQQARLLGGAALVPVTDDARELHEPIDLRTVSRVTCLRVLDLTEIAPLEYEDDWLSPRFGMPRTYTLTPQSQGGVGVPGAVIHASRVIHIDGVGLTRRRSIRRGGWGASVAHRMIDSLRDLRGTSKAMANIVDEWQYSVAKIKGLTQAASDDRTRAALIERSRLIARTKRIGRVILIDSDEDWSDKHAAVSGMADIWDRAASMFSADSGVPLTLLFGQAPSGLSTDDYGGRSYYYDYVRDEQSKLEPAINRIVEVVCAAQEGPTGGRVPERWRIEWPPLETPTEDEESTTRLRNAQSDAIYLDRGVVEPGQVSRDRFGGLEYGRDLTLPDGEF